MRRETFAGCDVNFDLRIPEVMRAALTGMGWDDHMHRAPAAVVSIGLAREAAYAFERVPLTRIFANFESALAAIVSA